MLADYQTGKDQKLYAPLTIMQAYGKAVAEFRQATGDCKPDEALAARRTP